MRPISGKTIVVAVVTIAVAGYLLLDEDRKEDRSAGEADRTERMVERSFELLTAVRPVPAELQSSQSESTTNGKMQAIQEGMPIVSSDMRSVLDVLLSNHQGRPNDKLLQDIESQIQSSLAPEAAQRAVQLLRPYMAYRIAEDDLHTRQLEGVGMTTMDAYDQMVALRRKYFDGDTAADLFAADEARMRYDITSAAIEADGSLSTSEKQARRSTLKETIFRQVGIVVGADEKDDETLRVEERVVALRNQGGSATQVQQLREQSLGLEASWSIGEMERLKKDWEYRSSDYQAKKAALAARLGTGVSEAEHDALLRQIYSDRELIAARAYNIERERFQGLGNHLVTGR